MSNVVDSPIDLNRLSLRDAYVEVPRSMRRVYNTHVAPLLWYFGVDSRFVITRPQSLIRHLFVDFTVYVDQYSIFILDYFALVPYDPSYSVLIDILRGQMTMCERQAYVHSADAGVFASFFACLSYMFFAHLFLFLRAHRRRTNLLQAVVVFMKQMQCAEWWDILVPKFVLASALNGVDLTDPRSRAWVVSKFRSIYEECFENRKKLSEAGHCPAPEVSRYDEWRLYYLAVFCMDNAIHSREFRINWQGWLFPFGRLWFLVGSSDQSDQIFVA